MCRKEMSGLFYSLWVGRGLITPQHEIPEYYGILYMDSDLDGFFGATYAMG